MLEAKDVKTHANRIRARVGRLALAKNGAYLAQACSSADILATLYGAASKLAAPRSTRAPKIPTQPPRPGQVTPRGSDFNGVPDHEHDRFVLSPAHYSSALYATLVEYQRLNEDELAHYAENGTSLEMIGSEQSPGLEATTGALAQGLSVAVGMALARKVRHDSGTVWVLVSDGELEEGQTWEALAAAAHHDLDNLVLIVDANSLQVDGRPSEVMNVEPIAERIRAFGLLVHEVDGHDPIALAEACLQRTAGQPTAVVCRTHPWQGLPLLADRYPNKLHFVRVRDDERAQLEIEIELLEGSEQK